jgi:hypothetical protein
MRLNTSIHLAGAVLASCMLVACSREEPQPPAATSQTQSSRESYMPTTVTGCLRSGDAANTYVLTTAATEGAGAARTYQLITSGGVNLEDHVGKRVEVSGIVESQSQIATRESPRPADNATGTAGQPGTPTVQTGTQLSIERIDVKSVRPARGDCGM